MIIKTVLIRNKWRVAILSLILVPLILYCCDQHDVEKTDPDAKVIHFDPGQAIVDPTNSYIDTIEFIPLAGRGRHETQIASVFKCIVSSDRIQILDINFNAHVLKLLSFDTSGNLKGYVDGSIEGPTDLSTCLDFDYFRDTIEVLDGLRQKILLFDKNANYIRSKPYHLDYRYFAKIDSGQYAFYANNRRGIENLSNNLILTNDQSDQKKVGAPINEHRSTSAFTINFSKVFPDVHKILFWQSYDYTIYEIEDFGFRNAFAFVPSEGNIHEFIRNNDRSVMKKLLFNNPDVIHGFRFCGMVEDKIVAVYFYQNNMYWLIHDLSEDSTALVQPQFPFINEFKISYTPLTVAADGSLISILDPMDIPRNSISKAHKFDWTVLLDSDPLDNPILMKIKLKL